MSSISGPSLLAVQSYATQTATPVRPTGPTAGTAATARAEAGAFSVALSDAAKAASATPASGTAFQPFVSPADMGARPVTQPAATTAATDTRPGPAPSSAHGAPQSSATGRPGGAPVRHQRPGTHLDIKV